MNPFYHCYLQTQSQYVAGSTSTTFCMRTNRQMTRKQAAQKAFVPACMLPPCMWGSVGARFGLLFPQGRPTASHRCCRCCWATRTCSAAPRRTWCGRAWISSWTRSKTATGPRSWEPSLRGRTSWCTGATALQVRIVRERASSPEPPSDLAALAQAWHTCLLKPTWLIRSRSIWTRASAVGSWCGRKACWRRDLGSVTGLQAALTSSCCFIGSRGTRSTSTELRGKKSLLLYSTNEWFFFLCSAIDKCWPLC